jgi:hypothetical protein
MTIYDHCCFHLLLLVLLLLLNIKMTTHSCHFCVFSIAWKKTTTACCRRLFLFVGVVTKKETTTSHCLLFFSLIYLWVFAAKRWWQL